MKKIQIATDKTYRLFDESGKGCLCVNFSGDEKYCSSNCPLFDAVEMPQESETEPLIKVRVTLRCGIATSAIFEQEIELPF